MTVQFTDGVNTETVFSAELTNEAVNLSVPVAEGWRGWMDARLEVVLSGADTVVNVTSAYIKVTGAITFSEWDGLR